MSRRNPWPISRKLTAVLVAVVVSVAANFTALAFSARSDAQARQENCDKVAALLDAYTVNLAAVAGASGSDEEAELRALTADSLAECS